MAISKRKRNAVRCDLSAARLKQIIGYYPGNSVVSAYASEWQTRPSPLPHGVRNNDADTNWIPRGMPVAKIRTGVGCVWCTPFYSVVPKFSCTEAASQALSCLSSLTLEAVIADPKYRHELYFDTSLQLEPPGITKEVTAPEAPVWQCARWELEGLLSANRRNGTLIRPPTPLLPNLLKSLRRLSLAITPLNCHVQVREVFSPKNIFHDDHFLTQVLALVSEILKTHCHPRRCRWSRKAIALFESTDIADLVEGFRITFGLLNMTILDQINATVWKMIPELVSTTSVIEWTYMDELLRTDQCSLRGIHQWLFDQPLVESIIFETCTPSQDVASSALSRLISGLVAQLTLPEAANFRVPLPKILALDASRLEQLQERFARCVRACITYRIRKAQGANPSEDFLAKSTDPNCTIYRIIEHRLMISTLHRLHQTFTSPMGRSKTIAKEPCCVTVGQELGSIGNELELLVRLHWSAAQSIYMCLKESEVPTI